MKKLYIAYSIILLFLGHYSFAQQVILDCSISNDNINGLKVLKYEDASVKGDLVYADTTIGKKHITLKFTLKDPAFFYFNNVAVYVHPNDSLRIFFIRAGHKRDSLAAKGNNAPYYNFWNQMAAASINLSYFFAAGKYTDNDWADYKNAIEDNLQNKLIFLKNYVEAYSLDKRFYTNTIQHIKYQMVADYVFPNYAFGQSNSNRVQVPASFYSSISQTYFKDFVSGPEYVYALNLYIKYLTDSRFKDTTDRLSGPYLAQLYATADKFFSGPTKKAALLDIFREYTVYNKDAYRTEYASFYDGLKKKYDDEETLKYIESLNSLYDVVNKPLPANILNSDLMMPDGKHITIKKMLDDHKNLVLYIDFWASWCLPCVQEIPYAISLHKKLADKNIAFIYLSMDPANLVAQWQKAATNLNITENQYLLVGDNNSPLAKYLSIYTIPRYIVLGGDGKILVKYASNPSDDKSLGMLTALIKN